mmetsp:Transcript_87840/g.190238  ORF Transcript_87840/g.190238 Transcript_87840/m.190238 type:complete len:211 (+) Transcript_87840:6-638(+)
MECPGGRSGAWASARDAAACPRGRAKGPPGCAARLQLGHGSEAVRRGQGGRAQLRLHAGGAVDAVDQGQIPHGVHGAGALRVVPRVARQPILRPRHLLPVRLLGDLVREGLELVVERVALDVVVHVLRPLLAHALELLQLDLVGARPAAREELLAADDAVAACDGEDAGHLLGGVGHGEVELRLRTARHDELAAHFDVDLGVILRLRSHG